MSNLGNLKMGGVQITEILRVEVPPFLKVPRFGTPTLGNVAFLLINYKRMNVNHMSDPSQLKTDFNQIVQYFSFSCHSKSTMNPLMNEVSLNSTILSFRYVQTCNLHMSKKLNLTSLNI